MALLWCDGFDDYATAYNSDVSDELDKRYTVVDIDNVLSSYGRVNSQGYSVRCADTVDFIRSRLDVSTDTLIVGVGLYSELRQIVWRQFLALLDHGTLGINFRYMTQLGEIAVFRGSTVLGFTNGAYIRQSSWRYIEVKVKCHSTAGTVEVRVGGETVLNLTGINTKAGDNDRHDTVMVSLNDSRADDFYVCDSSGSTHNDFLGNVRVVSLLPDADTSTNQWTCSTGTDHYALVDDSTEDADSTYVSSSTSSQTELWSFDSLPSATTVHGVNLVTLCRNTDNTSLGLKQVAYSGTSTDEGSAETIWDSEYVAHNRTIDLDPDTSTAWTTSSVNAASFGVKVG